MVALWMWIAVGVSAALGLSAVVGLALGAILGQIAREVSSLLENGPWAAAPSVRVSRPVRSPLKS
jgi:hypothetical protein